MKDEVSDSVVWRLYYIYNIYVVSVMLVCRANTISSASGRKRHVEHRGLSHLRIAGRA
jgi:hypothetical protein